MSIPIVFWGALWAVGSISLSLSAQPSRALQQHIDAMVADYVANTQQTALPYALMVGIIDDTYRYQYPYGRVFPNAPILPDTNTLFRIGSITKTFTATLLNALVLEKKITLDDPITRYLPDSVARANPLLSMLTLRKLATHTAGLPKEPLNVADTYADNNNPYQYYTIADLYRFLMKFEPQITYTKRKSKKIETKKITGTYQFNYSHTGILLLAHCLEIATSKSYTDLLQQYITAPLGIENTTLSPNETQVEMQLAPGFTFSGKPSQPISYGAVPGAEGIYSTCSDMLTYLNAYLTATPKDAFTLIDRPLAATTTRNVTTAGGWFMFRHKKNNLTILTHSGRAGGYACYVAFEPSRKIGVVLLVNSDQRIDELGIAILEFLLR